MYEWDENKRQKNIEKHEIDFIDVKEMWDYPVCEIFSLQTNHNKERFLAIGRIKKLTLQLCTHGEAARNA